MRLTPSEWIVMNAVWDRPVESSVRDVLEAVEAETGWVYQTLQTILMRLQQKGALTSRIRANTRLFKAKLSRQEAQLSAIHELVDAAFQGSPAELIRTLLGPDMLSPEERDELVRWLNQEGNR